MEMGDGGENDEKQAQIELKRSQKEKK